MIRPPPRSPLFPYTPLSRPSPLMSARQQNFARRRAQPARRQRSRQNQEGGPPAIDPIAFDAEREENAARRRVQDRQTVPRSEEHTSELQSQSNLVCRLLLEK